MAARMCRPDLHSNSWNSWQWFAILLCIVRRASAEAASPAAGPAIVNYTFEVSYFRVDPDCQGYTWVQGINGQLPGPEIRVRQHDRVRVTIENRLQVEELTVHWHGLEMRNAQEYDGALGITQCGIKPGTSSVYDFVVDEYPGTYMYHEHAHMEHVAARGLFGPLIVLPAAGDVDTWQGMHYDGEAVLTLSDWWKQSNLELERLKMARMLRPVAPSNEGNGVGILPFHNLLINGKGAFDVFATHVKRRPGYVNHCTRVQDLAHIEDLRGQGGRLPKAGETWRLRIINAGIVFSMRFRIDGHRLRVIQADGADVEPYECDAVTMSSGERFDVLVTFDQTPGSYWMRVETLENIPGLHHGQLGVLRYDGTEEGVAPIMGFPRKHSMEDSPNLVTLNCVDQKPLFADKRDCRPITDLVRHPLMPAHVGEPGDSTHDFELNSRAFGGVITAHFVRLLDLNKTLNTFGDDQFGGEYVQFYPPQVPYSYVGGTDAAHHPNTLAMTVEYGETVRVFLQQQDRVAHPWHLHGHKFAVLGIGAPNFTETCDILYCRSKHNHWLSRDGLPSDLLDPSVAPLKDTVYVPAGGWVVLQFKADNPGWWFFHCHMLVHAHDGMALMLIEGTDRMPERLSNKTYMDSTGLPSCDEELHKFEEGYTGLSCSCWESPEMKLDNLPRASYKCSKPYLCGEALISMGDPEHASRKGARDRAAGRTWRYIMVALWFLVVSLLFALKRVVKRQSDSKAELVRMVMDATAWLKAEDLKSQELDGTEVKVTGSMRAHGAAIGRCYEQTDGLSMRCSARCRVAGEPEGYVVAGGIGSGSVLAVLGSRADTDPMLHFFAGRAMQGLTKVEGHLCYGTQLVEEWDETLLGQSRGCVLDKRSSRGNCTVVDALDLRLRLTYAPQYYQTQHQRVQHLARFAQLFKLGDHLDKRVDELNQEVLTRVLIAQEAILPRRVFIIKAPLDDLNPPAVTRMLQLFSILAENLNVSVIFSCSTCIPRDACRFVTDVMVLGTAFKPFFGGSHKLDFFCGAEGRPVPDGYAPLEWASELVVKGMFDQGRPVSKRFTIAGMKSWLNERKSMSQSSTMGSAGKIAGICCRRRTQTTGLRTQRAFPVQCLILLQYQFAGDLQDAVTIYRLAETVGIGVLSGLVWFQKGSVDTQTALGEVVGLVFFSTALYTVPPVFQALAVAPAMVTKVSAEYACGLYTVSAYMVAFTLSAIATTVVWAPVWQIVSYTLADVGASPGAMLTMHVVLSLNVITMRSIGLFLAMVFPSALLNVVIGNLFAQLCMLTNGFYTKLPPWFQWITNISIPRYTFKALLKLEYSWRDSFQVHPMHGVADFGFPTMYIPAEITGFFQLMAERQLGVMESPHDSSTVVEIIFLAGFSLLFTSLALITLSRKASCLKAPRGACKRQDLPPLPKQVPPRARERIPTPEFPVGHNASICSKELRPASKPTASKEQHKSDLSDLIDKISQSTSGWNSEKVAEKFEVNSVCWAVPTEASPVKPDSMASTLSEKVPKVKASSVCANGSTERSKAAAPAQSELSPRLVALKRQVQRPDSGEAAEKSLRFDDCHIQVE